MPPVFRSMLADGTGLVGRNVAVGGGGTMNPSDAIRHGRERSFSIARLKLNGLIDAGLGDDAEADAVRDDMDSDGNNILATHTDADKVTLSAGVTCHWSRRVSARASASWPAGAGIRLPARRVPTSAPP